jgi:hypothetical protein
MHIEIFLPLGGGLNFSGFMVKTKARCVLPFTVVGFENND